MPRPPVYFLSHGGPNLIEETHHPAYHHLQLIGREITSRVRPTAILILSAHWPGEPHKIEVNVAEPRPLIYDFYGFPQHYYEVEFPHTTDPELAGRVLGILKGEGLQAEGVRRGLDHGVYVPFLVAFDPKKNPLKCPIVQVSLFDSDSVEQHLALGRALGKLRDEGVLIVGGGMTVHNLRDLMRGGKGEYSDAFDAAVKEAVEGDVSGRDERVKGLFERKDLRKAHPSLEHLMPVVVAAGAAGEDKGRCLWTMTEGPLAWGMYRFGEVEGGL